METGCKTTASSDSRASSVNGQRLFHRLWYPWKESMRADCYRLRLGNAGSLLLGVILCCGMAGGILAGDSLMAMGEYDI